MKAWVESIADLDHACPSCGGDSYGVRVCIGSIAKVVGICKCCPESWPIPWGETFAYKRFMDWRRHVVNGEVSEELVIE